VLVFRDVEKSSSAQRNTKTLGIETTDGMDFRDEILSGPDYCGRGAVEAKDRKIMNRGAIKATTMDERFRADFSRSQGEK
jgi:hypothetical protein